MRPRHAFFCLLLCAFAALSVSVGAHAHSAPQHKPKATPTPTPTPRPHKTPPGAKGYAQFAARDASDKLLTGGATRGTGAQAYFGEGKQQYQKGNLEAAANAFTQAIKLAPHWSEAHYSLAIVLGEQDKWEESVAEFQRALAEKPDDSLRLLISYNLGNAYLDLGDYPNAADFFRRTIQMAPNEPTPHYNLALALVAQDQKDKAAEEFQAALRLKPDYKEALYNLALVHWQLGQQDTARAEQQRLKTLDAKMARDLDALFH